MYLRIAVGGRSQEQLSITIILYNTSLKPGHDCVRVGQIARARQDSALSDAGACQAWTTEILGQYDTRYVRDLESRVAKEPKSHGGPRETDAFVRARIA